MLELENVIKTSKRKLGSLREKIIREFNQSRENSNIINDLDEIISELTVLLDSKIDNQDFKKSEEKYKSLNKELELILDNIPALIFYKDLNNNYIRVNKACVEANKMPKTDLESKSLFDIYPNEIAQAYYNDDLEVARTKKPKLNIEEPLETQNGKGFYLTDKIPIINDSGTVTGILGFAINITECKEIEEKLIESQLKLGKLNQELERRVLERTKDLKESEEKYSHLFKSTPYPIIIMDAKGTIVDCNHYEDKITGYKRENLIGKNVFDIPIFPPNFLKDAITDFKKLRKGDIPKSKELQIIKKDGSIIWVQPRASAFKIKGKMYFQIIMHDITVPKNTELQLRESEELYRTTINSISDVLHVIDKDFQVILVNDSLKKWYKNVGVNSKPVGLNLLETYNFLPSKVFDEYQKVFETKEPLISFERIVLNNKIYYTETRKIPIIKENKVKQILTVIRDITENKISEQRLKDSEEKFRTISEESFVGIIINQDGITKYANQRAADIIGYEIDEMILMNASEMITMVHPDDRAFFINQKRELFQNNDINALNYIFRAKKKNGDLIWVNNYDKLIHFDDQLAISSIFMDITEQKRVENALKDSEERFKTLFELTPASIVFSNLDSNIIMSNNQFVKLHDITNPEKLKGMSVTKFFSKKDLPTLKESIQKSLKGEPPELVEYTMLREDGTEFQAEASSFAVRDKNGIVVGLIGVAQDITNRKKVEIELKESEQKFRDLFESSPISLWEEDLSELKNYFEILKNSGIEDFRAFFDKNPVEVKKCVSMIKIVDINKKTLELYKANKKEDFFGGLGNVFTEESLYAFKELIISLAGGKTRFESEAINCTINGEKLYIYIVCEVVAGFKEDWSKVLVSITDISDRKKAEQELIESEEKFRTITEQSFMGIIIIQDGLFKYFNQRAADINGYSVEEIQDWKPYEFAKLLHPEDREFVMEQARKKQDGEIDVISRYTYRLIKKSGEIAWMDNYSKNINYRGKLADLVMTEDITDKIIAEQQLRESEEFFRTITEQSLLGIIIIQDGILKYVNDVALNHAGLMRDEIMNLHESQLLKYIHPKDHSKIEQIIAEPNPYMTFRLVSQDGNIKWIDLHMKNIIYKGTTAFLISLLDVTEKKRAEQIIQDEITKLKDLDELKNEFVYRASHELKTPLNSVVSASALLIDSYRDSLDERAYSLINVINKGGKRLDSLIGDLLDVSRIETRKLTMKKKKEDIVEIIKGCIYDMTYLIKRRNLNLEFKQLPERIFINVDKIRIEQVILNILSNSIKNTPSDGTISINIKAEQKFIDLSITDTGVGFTKKEKEKLFQKFGKIERHGKGMDIIPEGTGLGLYISKEIIELHQGEIWIESQGRNKGSTIIIRLPYKKLY